MIIKTNATAHTMRRRSARLFEEANREWKIADRIDELNTDNNTHTYAIARHFNDNGHRLAKRSVRIMAYCAEYWDWQEKLSR